jgi:hypothetical protein
MRGNVFISYRRDDSPGIAGRLFDHLQRHFPRQNLFMDVDGVLPGTDFVQEIDQRVSGCAVLLAVIGLDWLTAKGANGQRRLDSAEDFVRIEIAAAIARGVRVIPVLVDGAAMPTANELPDNLKALARRNAIELRHTRFFADAEQLVVAIKDLIRQRRAVGTHCCRPRPRRRDRRHRRPDLALARCDAGRGAARGRHGGRGVPGRRQRQELSRLRDLSGTRGRAGG